MSNVIKGQDSKPNSQSDERSKHKTTRGLLSLGHAFYNKYATDTEQNASEKAVDRKWVKIGAAAAIIYTAITAVIMCVNIYQASISRDTELRQLRAYVSISPGDVEGFGQASQHVRFIRRNSGSTPAYDVGFSRVGFAVIQPGGPIPFGPSGCARKVVDFNLGTIFPNTDMKLDVNINNINFESNNSLKDALKSVTDGNSYFVYFGNICYRDAFGGNHYTNYCWMYKGEKMKASDAEGCLSYNDSD